jgi:hypothetical protein
MHLPRLNRVSLAAPAITSAFAVLRSKADGVPILSVPVIADLMGQTGICREIFGEFRRPGGGRIISVAVFDSPRFQNRRVTAPTSVVTLTSGARIYPKLSLLGAYRCSRPRRISSVPELTSCVATDEMTFSVEGVVNSGVSCQEFLC